MSADLEIELAVEREAHAFWKRHAEAIEDSLRDPYLKFEELRVALRDSDNDLYHRLMRTLLEKWESRRISKEGEKK